MRRSSRDERHPCDLDSHAPLCWSPGCRFGCEGAYRFVTAQQPSRNHHRFRSPQALLRTVSADRRLYWQKILIPDETVLSTFRSADTWRGNPGAIWAVRHSASRHTIQPTARPMPRVPADTVAGGQCSFSSALRRKLAFSDSSPSFFIRR